MHFKIAKELFTLQPDLKIGALVVKGIDNSVNSDHGYQYLCKEIDLTRIKHRESDLNQIEGIKCWNELFKKVGLDPDDKMPSHKALFTRALNKMDPPNINCIVNLTNGLSFRFETPFGAHDMEKIKGDIEVGRNSKSLPYTPFGSEKSETVDEKVVVYADQEKVLTSNFIWRQSELNKIDENSKDIFVPIDTIGKSDDEIREIAEQFLALLKRFTTFSTAGFAIASSDNNSIDLDRLEKLDSDFKVNIHTVEISRDERIISKILEKAVEKVVPGKEMLEKMLLSGRRLKVYQGYDPTADTLHIGHTVMMQKLEDFRKLGHEVFMLIGDFTARIGDPTDKTSARVTLTKEEVNRNLEAYKDQAASILDINNKENPVTVVFNADWLEKMDFSDILNLCSEFTVQQMIKRDMFQKRLEEEKPIYIHEFLYPLMQGWDSVNMQVDIELGGSDQFFNMLAGRQLVGSHLLKEKVVVSGKLLTTNEGKKMGKTEGNMIKLSDSAKDIYGKVMAFSDGAILPGFELLTDADMAEIKAYAEVMEKEVKNPMELKKELAFRLTKQLKGEGEAFDAAKYFEEVYQTGEMNTEVERFVSVNTDPDILTILVEAGLAQSKSVAKRLVLQGAVRVGEKRVEDIHLKVDLHQEPIIRAGKQVKQIVAKN